MKMMIVASALIVAGASNALAADAAIEDVAPASGAYDWSGFYVGVHGGYSAGKSQYGVYELDMLRVFADPDPRGYLGGVHAGYVSQFSNGFVLGGEADLSYNASDGSGGAYLVMPYGNIPDPDVHVDAEVKWTGSARARLGYAMDRLLPYVTAGVAVARVESDFIVAGNSSQPRNDTHIGWTLGMGAEYAVTEKVSLRAEYRYSDYGVQDSNLPYLGNLPAKMGLKAQDVRFGISYKF
ncbi:outer membrane protein [Aminobacter sp. UC22_36]|uniref:outer membrane protein n=1 Tax=Aminobacter sp. UC22_36 TaxID=3374549 RepID=UPI0037564543